MALDVTVGFTLKEPSTPERSSRRRRTPKNKPDDNMRDDNNGNGDDSVVDIKSPVKQVATIRRSQKPKETKQQVSSNTMSQVKSTMDAPISPPKGSLTHSDEDALASLVSSPGSSPTRKHRSFLDDTNSSVLSPLRPISTASGAVETDELIIFPQSASIKATTEALPTKPVLSMAESNKSSLSSSDSTLSHKNEPLTEQRSPETYVSSESSSRVVESHEPLEAPVADAEISNDEASVTSAAVCPATFNIFDMLTFSSPSAAEPITAVETQSTEQLLSKAVVADSSLRDGETEELVPTEPLLTSDIASSSLPPDEIPEDSAIESAKTALAFPAAATTNQTTPQLSIDSDYSELTPISNSVDQERYSSGVMEIQELGPINSQVIFSESQPTEIEPVEPESTVSSGACPVMNFSKLDIFDMLSFSSSSVPKPTTAETQSPEPLISKADTTDSLPREVGTGKFAPSEALVTSEEVPHLSSDDTAEDPTAESIKSALESPAAMSTEMQPLLDEVDSPEPQSESEVFTMESSSPATEVQRPITDESLLNSLQPSLASGSTYLEASNIQSSPGDVASPVSSQPWASFDLLNNGILNKISPSSPSSQKPEPIIGKLTPESIPSEPIPSDSLLPGASTRQERAANWATTSPVVRPDVMITTPSYWQEEENGPDDEAEDDGPDDETQENRSQEMMLNETVDRNPQQMGDSVERDDTLEHDEAIQDMILNDFSSEDCEHPDLEAILQRARRDLAAHSASSPEDRLEAALLRAKSSAAALQAEHDESRAATTEDDQHRKRLALEADVLFSGHLPSSGAWESSMEQVEDQMLRAELDQAREVADKYSRHEVGNLGSASRQTTIHVQNALAAPAITETLAPNPLAVEVAVEDPPKFREESSDEVLLHRLECSDASEEEDEIISEILDEFTTASDIATTAIQNPSAAQSTSVRSTSPLGTISPPLPCVVNDTKEVRLFFRFNKASKEQTPLPSNESMEKTDVVDEQPDVGAEPIDRTTIDRHATVSTAKHPSTPEIDKSQAVEDGRPPASNIGQTQALPCFDTIEKEVETTNSEFETGENPKRTLSASPDSSRTLPTNFSVPQEHEKQPAGNVHNSKEVRLFFRAKSLKARQAQKLSRKKFSENEKEVGHDKSGTDVSVQANLAVPNSLDTPIIVDSPSSPTAIVNASPTSATAHDATELHPNARAPPERRPDLLKKSGTSQGNDGAGARQPKDAVSRPVDRPPTAHLLSMEYRAPTTPKLDNAHHLDEKSPIYRRAKTLTRTDPSEEENKMVHGILDVGASSSKIKSTDPYPRGRPITAESPLPCEPIPSKNPKPVDIKNAKEEPRLFGAASMDDRQPHILKRSDTSEEEDEIVHNILDEFTTVAKHQMTHSAPSASTLRISPIASPPSFATNQDKKGLRDSYYVIAKAKREREEAEKRRADETLTSAQLEREASRLLSIQKLEAGIQRLEAERKELRRVEVRKAIAAQPRFQQKTPPKPDVSLSRSGLFVAPNHQNGRSFVLLISKTSGAPTQKSNQEKALVMLQCRKLPFVLVDGSDPIERDLRNDLFGISGIRGNYPQLFLQQQDGKISFVGDFATIENLNEAGALGGLVSQVGDDNPTPRRNAASSVNGTTTVNGKSLVVLLSTSSGSLVQKSNQDRALALLDSSRIRPEILDGADASNTELRNHLFGVSGILGVYPQFFLKEVATGEYSFFGTYRTIESMNDEGPLEELFG